MLIPWAVYAQSDSTPPTNLTAQVVDGDVLLNWDAPTEDASSIIGYEILRQHPGNGENELTTLVADTSSTDTSYTDTTATESGLQYTYGVKALRGSVKSDLSNHAFAEVPEDICQGYNPVAVEVGVTTVPIVVESTTDEYFVLYARHELDADTTMELAVLVARGEAGTTTLAENVEALPKERYRVEKYLVADPADVDGDCIDDITELNNLGQMNPVNPAAAIDISDGAVTVPNRAAFEALYNRRSQGYIKFVLFGLDTARPGVYFMNVQTHRYHLHFLDAVGMDQYLPGTIVGEVIYDPKLVAPNGSPGVYWYWLRAGPPFRFVARAHTVLAASMPLIDDNLAFFMGNHSLMYELPLYRASRILLVFEQDIHTKTGFAALNTGVGYGLLREMSGEERPNPRDIVIYETLPNDLPRVAGIISTVPQTPLSHINLRAIQDAVPNASIRDALDDVDIDGLIGSHVRYEVTGTGYTMRAATKAEVDAHHDASRPITTQTPQRDLSVTEITPLGDVEFDDWTVFGVKAANVATLGTLGFPAGTVPGGFGVPFYFYDEFMKANDLYTEVEAMLADPDFQTDFDTQGAKLKKLRKKIKKGTTPAWIITALEEMHATYPEGQSLRYRSSTNNEDLPGFSGAGLYDSKTQDPDETEEDGIDKSIKGVWASLWNFRAFVERDFHRIDHLTTAMGVLVHPNYSDELANGVSVSYDPINFRDRNYYVNTQVGEDLVTNPEALSVPEEILLHQSGTYTVLKTSNRLPLGQLIMSDAQLDQLRRHLSVIHDEFAKLYGVGANEPFAMEIEFKITSDDILAIKQARPWVFSNSPATGEPTISGVAHLGETLTADTSNIADADGLDSALFSYQWIRSDGTTDTDIQGATDASYTLVAADEGNTIAVRVSFSDDTGHPETLTSAATEAAAAVEGPPEESQEPPAAPQNLTATVNEDGSVTLTWDAPDDDSVTGYQVLRRLPTEGEDSLLVYEEDTGSTATVYTDTGVTADVLHAYRVKAINGAGLSEQSNYVNVTPTEPEEPVQNTPATGAPVISGTVEVGETLTAETSGIADEDGLGNATFSYQWIAGGADIEGATDASYTLTEDEEGLTVQVWVSFTDDAGNPESLTSAATDTVAAKPNSSATGAPVISGTVQVGETLTAETSGIADEDGLSNVTFSYQWVRNDGSGDADIAGATGATYTLVDADEGKTIRVRVSFTDDAGNEETLTSAATDTVAAAPTLLTASIHHPPESHDGQNAFTFELRFSEEPDPGFSYKTLRDHAFTVTDGAVTGARRLERPSNVRWEITVLPDSDAAVTVVLPVTADCEDEGGHLHRGRPNAVR